jgi:hypothetical protein
VTDVANRFRVRRGTAANLASINEVPLLAELVVETDTRKAKLGDGVTAFNSLSYSWVVPGAVTTSGLTMATARLLGRTTASTGAVEAISVDSGLALASGVLGIASGYALPLTGTGTPEGAVTAPVGTLFLRTDGGAGTTLYVKESGTGNTGWAAK